MILARLISGLGNQLFQYAISRQVAISRGVPLKFDTSFFETQQLRAYKLEHYNIQAEIASRAEVEKFLEIYKTKKLSARVYRTLERQFPKRMRHYYKQSEWWIYEPGLLKANGNIYLDGYWQHHKYFEHLYPQIREELTLKKTGAKDADKLAAEIAGNPQSVSLHIRRGDYITNTANRDFMGVLPLEYYHRAMGYLGKKLPDPHYYIFSDDLQWAKDHLKVAAPMQYVDIQNGSQDCVELDLMRTCRHNIIANSSFSWWGAYLNNNSDKIVIIPDRWVIPDNINAEIHLAFPSWVKL